MYFLYILAWAVGASAMSVLERGPLVLAPLSAAGSLAGILYLYHPAEPWIAGAGLCAGAAITYLLRAARSNTALGYGIGLGAAAVMFLSYLRPHVPGAYFKLAVSVLPILWLLALPALRSRPPLGAPDREGQRRWGYVAIMVFSVCVTAGVYQHSIFFELSVIGVPHHFILFLSLSTGALIIGHTVWDGGLRLSYAQPFMLAVPLSLALFGFRASTLTYMFSDALIGFGLGWAAVFILLLIRGYGSLQRAACLGVAGLGLVVGSRLSDISRSLYGIDMEGLVFITLILFIAGTVPAMLTAGTRRAPEPAPPEPAQPEEGDPALEEPHAPLSVAEGPHFPSAEEKTPSQAFCDTHKLSRREGEVLDVLLKGKTIKEIAEAIFVSESTVKTHIRHIYTKAGVRNKLELLKKIQSL